MRIKLVVDIQPGDLSAITDLIGQQTAATFMQHIIDRADMATESDDDGDEDTGCNMPGAFADDDCNEQKEPLSSDDLDVGADPTNAACGEVDMFMQMNEAAADEQGGFQVGGEAPDDHGDEQACSVIITDVLPSGEVHVFQGDSDAQVKLDDGTLRAVKVVRA